MPERASSASTLARWCDETPYFSAISAVAMWRPGSLANSSTLKSASDVFFCSLMARGRRQRHVCAQPSRSISSESSDPATMPWLRKNDRIRVLSRASNVRSLLTPVRRKAALMASSSRVPTPPRRNAGSTSMAKTQPQGGDPNSQSRTSPMTKPTTCPCASDRSGQQFLVALAQGHVVGFVIGEVRDWEFGSPPCGWVFAIDVHPQARLGGIGTRLLEAISASFYRAGVRKLRTMLARDNGLILSFFRSQGMMAGPLISLEMDLEG